MKDHDPVNHPRHYTGHPSGVEAITITEHMGFCLGNAMKYIWRADMKNGLEDLEKAKWYIEREIAKRKLSDTRGLGRAEAPTNQPPLTTEQQWKKNMADKIEFTAAGKLEGFAPNPQDTHGRAVY